LLILAGRRIIAMKNYGFAVILVRGSKFSEKFTGDVLS
jgi:hypothetical protein